MKKNIIYSFIMMAAVVLFTACGSDSKEDPPAPDGPYSFFNATTPLVVTAPMIDENGTIQGDGYTLAVQLLEYDLIKTGELVEMKSFPLQYGFVTDMIVSTTTNGYAVFTYYPPEDYAAVIGQDTTIQAVYVDYNSTSTTPDILLTQDFVLQFR